MKSKLSSNLFKSAFLCMTLALTSISAHAFEEGKDYKVLEKPIPNAEKTLIKVFSYDCPFCYKYDKAVTPKVMEKVGDIVEFKPYHLETKGKYGPQASELFAVLIVKDEANKIPLLSDKSEFKKAKFAYYNAYHDKKERWDGGAEDFLKTGLDAVGMSKADFEKALQDPQVKTLIKTWQDASYDVAKIQGVPGFVVNGKYLVYTKSIKSIDGFADLVRELAAK